MKLSLRTLALGAAIAAVGAMNAQDAPTVTQKWISHDLINAGFENGGDVRAGSGAAGKAYISNSKSIMTYDGTEVKTLYTADVALNRGLVTDDMGNVLVSTAWAGNPIGKTWLLISADGQTVKELTITAPSSSAFAGGRSDLQGRAVGDFFSEEGGVFYLTCQNETFAIPVFIANGEVQDPEYATDDAGFAAANNMAYAQPAAPRDQIDADNMMYSYYYAASNMAEIGYATEDGEAAYINWPNADQLPNTWYTKNAEGVANITRGQNGFDVFELGGVKYAIHHFGPVNWNSNFAIWNIENGDVLFHTNYVEGDEFYGDKTGNGCGLFARVIDEYTAQIYQVYTNATNKGISFTAMYEVTLPKQVEPAISLYLAGQFQGWNPAEPAEFVLGEDGIYTLDLVQTGGGLKMSTTKGTWDDFNAGVIGVKGNALAIGEFELEPGNTSDIALANGTYTLSVDLANNKISVAGEVSFSAPELYVRGTLNDWGHSDATKMVTDGEVNGDGYVVYTWSAPELKGEYKIATTDWAVSLGGNFSGAGTFELERGGENNNLKCDLGDVTLKLLYPEDMTKAPKLTVSGIFKAERKAFAYNLKGEALENDQYKVSFTSTNAAEEGEVILRDENGQTVLNVPVANVVKGENSVVVDLADLEEGNYTWFVRLYSTLDSEIAGVAYQAPIEWTNNDNMTGGIAIIRDVNEAAYGYTVLGMGKAHGFVVFNPEGEIMNENAAPAWVGFNGFTASNGSSTTRGDALRGYAVFADWSDKGSGYWRINPLDLSQAPVNMLMVEGATQAADGTVTYNGVATGSGSPAVAFHGEGEDTEMFGFDEDIYKNTLVRYKIGTADMITTAPYWVCESKSQFANTNINVVPVEQGYYVTQQRADINDANVPAIMFFDYDNNRLWTTANDPAFEGVNGTNSGLAITMDGAMAAVGTYSDMKIHIFAIQYDEYNEPTFTLLYSIDQVPATNSNGRWAQMRFDAGNNLHVYDRRNGGYKVYVLPYTSVATATPKAEYLISKSSGIEGVTVGADEAPVQYFNLQGIAVDADNLTPGVYVRRQGNTATKVVIK